MTTNTAQVIPPARQDPRQVINTLTKIVNWNDPGIATGNPFDNSLPQGASITNVQVEILQVFDGTPVLVVGTNGTFNNIVAAADVDETALGVTQVATGLGSVIAAAAAVTPTVKFTSAAATQGKAKIVISFEGGWKS